MNAVSAKHLTRQINSDWQKPRRFALNLLPAGYLQRSALKKREDRLENNTS